MRERGAYLHISTVGGAEVTASAGPAKLGGFFLNGSAGSSTLNILDGSTVILSTSAGANELITVNLNVPIAMRNNILGTCSGTGFYSIFIAT